MVPLLDVVRAVRRQAGVQLLAKGHVRRSQLHAPRKLQLPAQTHFTLHSSHIAHLAQHVLVERASEVRVHVLAVVQRLQLGRKGLATD